MTDVGSVLSVEEMLARSAANVKTGKTTANMSAVEKLLAQRDTPLPDEDTVSLSPVQKIVQAQQADKAKQVNYFESEEYLQLKVSQLQQQIAIYSNLPGLDPSGAVMDGIEAEIKDILSKQQERLQESLKKGEDAEAKLREQEAARAAELVSADDMLARVQGKTKGTSVSKEVQALLNKVKGSSVNTSA